jgi:hypothetical protein
MNVRVPDLIVQVAGLADSQAQAERLRLIDEYVREAQGVITAASDLKDAISSVNEAFQNEETTDQQKRLRKCLMDECSFIATLRSSRKRIESGWDQRLRKSRDALTRDNEALVSRWRDLIGVIKEKAQALASSGEADGDVRAMIACLTDAINKGPVKSDAAAVRQANDQLTKFIEKHPGGNALAEWLARVKAGKVTLADLLDRPAVIEALRSRPTLAKKLKVIE